MADTKVSAFSEISVPALEDLLYLIDDPSGSPLGKTASNGRLLGQLLRGICGFRLTTESGVGFSTADRTAQGTLYATPYGPFAGLITIYDGTRWRLYDNAQVSLALTVTANSNYDVFIYNNAGTLTLELSAVWTNATTRADAVAAQDNIYVKSGATTRRWLGTIRASGTNVTEDSAVKRFIYNGYNKETRDSRTLETTAHDYSSATARSWNNDATVQLGVVLGEPQSVRYGLKAQLTTHPSGSSGAVYAVWDWGSGYGADDCASIFFGIPLSFGIDLQFGSTSMETLPMGYHYVRAVEAEFGANPTTFSKVLLAASPMM